MIYARLTIIVTQACGQSSESNDRRVVYLLLAEGNSMILVNGLAMCNCNDKR